MAEIQMIYRVGKCIHSDPEIRKEHCGNCHTSSSWLTGCKAFHPSDRGDCACADFTYIYAVETVNECEMQEFVNEYSPWMNCMIVNIKGTIIECKKVMLNGECIYEQDENGNKIEHPEHRNRKSGHWSSVPIAKKIPVLDGYEYCSVCGMPEKFWNTKRKYCAYCGSYLGDGVQ